MGNDFCMGSESRRWISVQSAVPFYPQCAVSPIMKSQRSIGNEFQFKAKQDVILLSKTSWERRSHTK